MVVTESYSYVENRELRSSKRYQMSSKSGGRNLLGLNIEIDKRSSFIEDGSEQEKKDVLSEPSKDYMETPSGTILQFMADENRNSIIDIDEHPIDLSPTNICEVTTTEILERKTKKKSAIKSIRKLVRTTVVTLDSNSNTNSSAQGAKDNVEIKEKKDSTSSRRKISIPTRYRKKRNRRSRVIPNEGAPLWQPLESYRWKATYGPIVSLDDIEISVLCEAEQNALKSVSLQILQDHCLDCQINVPKENQSVAARRRWKQLLQLQKKPRKQKSENQETKPQNPVFSIDLSQVIENDKTVERAHEIAYSKLNTSNPQTSMDDESEDIRYKETTRRLSDPLVVYGDIDDVEISDYMLNALRTIDTLKEEEEEDLGANRRKSRLIEALTLSSTSASSSCILDKDAEFTPHIPQVPKVILQTVHYISKYALNTVGIFRTGGSRKRVKQMMDDYDMGHSDVINENSNPHDVAAIFKEFLRSLPDPLLTRELYPAFLAAAKRKDQESLDNIIINLVRLLPAPNRDTLKSALECLNLVAFHSMDTEDQDGNLVSGNKMDARNLATLMAPNILHRCKPYKTQSAFQADTLNPENNKDAIDIICRMIELNDHLFKIPPSIHHKVLKKLLDIDPETVDFVLRKKASRTSLMEVISSNSDETTQYRPRTSNSQRPSSAGPRTRYSFEEVSFHKTNSFNNGPYKPFVRLRKESSSGSRPTSTKSDPPDRNSVRKSASGFVTPPSSERFRRLSHQEVINHDISSKRDSSSPRDSGVVLSVTPPFKRNSLLRSSKEFNKVSPLGSPAAPNVVFRNPSRDRLARDSAYESGFKSNTNSVNLSHSLNAGYNDEIKEYEETANLKITRHSSFPTQGEKLDLLNDVLNTPSIQAPLGNVKQRKISLPVMPTNYNNFQNQQFPSKSPSSDRAHKASTIDFDISPDWQLHMKNTTFPDQETTL